MKHNMCLRTTCVTQHTYNTWHGMLPVCPARQGVARPPRCDHLHRRLGHGLSKHAAQVLRGDLGHLGVRQALELASIVAVVDAQQHWDAVERVQVDKQQLSSVV